MMKIDPRLAFYSSVKCMGSLMVIALANNCRYFASEIIAYIFDRKCLFGIATKGTRELFEKHLMNNTFFDKNIGTNRHVEAFRKVLIGATLETNRIFVLNRICKNVPTTHLGELLCWL